MAVVYVDPTKAANGAGTFTDPRNIPPTSVAYGDKVLFKEGTVYPGGWTLPTPTGVGSDGNRLTIGTYFAGDGSQAISWNYSATVQGTGSADAVLASGVSYVYVVGLKLTGGRNFPNAGFRGLSGSYWTVRHCEISGNNYGVRYDNVSGASRTSWKVVDCRILSTTGNAGIITVWSATVNEYVTDVVLQGNYIAGTTENAANSGGQGIFVVARANPCYTNAAALKGKGFKITDNTIVAPPNKAISIYGVEANGASLNYVSRNSISDVGDRRTDVHCIWMAGCEDFFVEDNIINGPYAWEGQSVGTGVGIFVDVVNISGVNSDSCNRMTVRRNVVRNTGQGATLNTEVGGGGIMVLQSTNVVVESNVMYNCQNGVVVLGYYGTGIQANNVDVRNNAVVNSRRSGYYVAKVANNVSVRNNIAHGGERGFYIENSGAGAVTNYSETNNLAYGASILNWAGGNEPTVGSPTITSRSPSGTNLTQDPLFEELSDPWFGLKSTSPCKGAGVAVAGAADRFGNRFQPKPNIGPWAHI